MASYTWSLLLSFSLAREGTAVGFIFCILGPSTLRRRPRDIWGLKVQVCIIKHSFKGLFRYSILSNICSTCLDVVPIVTAMGLDRATSSTASLWCDLCSKLVSDRGWSYGVLQVTWFWRISTIFNLLSFHPSFVVLSLFYFYLEKLNLNCGCIRLWSRGLLTLYASNQGQSNNGLGLNQPVIFYECMLFCLRNVCSLSPRKFSVCFRTAMGSSAATCFLVVTLAGLRAVEKCTLLS